MMDLEYINKRNIRRLEERIEKLEKKVKYLERDKKTSNNELMLLCGIMIEAAAIDGTIDQDEILIEFFLNFSRCVISFLR